MGPASFRGVPFYVETSERGGGRRNVTHEFPLRDVPYVDDLGRAARVFSVEGYVVGDDYIARRDALLSALEEEGPGELVHPYHGTRRVAVTGGYRVRETRADGGTAVFAVEFTETEAEARYPSAAPSGAASVAASAVAARESLGADFLASYRPGTLTGGLADMLRAATLSIDNVLGVVRMTTDELAAMRVRLDNMYASAAALVTAPADVFFAVTAALELDSIDALVAIYGFDPGIRPPATTTTRAIEQAAYDALLSAIRTLVAIQAAEVAPGLAFDSHDAAVSARGSVLEMLDEQAEAAGDEVFADLAELRAALVRAVPGEDRDLPRLVRFTPAGTVPSLVLAHQLYGDLGREADIVARNRVQRPGFIRGGVELEVLSASA